MVDLGYYEGGGCWLVAKLCVTLLRPPPPPTHTHTQWVVARLASSVHGILQARILRRVAIPFPRKSSRPRD